MMPGNSAGIVSVQNHGWHVMAYLQGIYGKKDDVKGCPCYGMESRWYAVAIFLGTFSEKKKKKKNIDNNNYLITLFPKEFCELFNRKCTFCFQV